jgi:hypothetical protein
MLMAMTHTVNLPQLISTTAATVAIVGVAIKWVQRWVRNSMREVMVSAPELTDLADAVKHLSDSNALTTRELTASLNTLAVSVARLEGGQAARDNLRNRRGEDK